MKRSVSALLISGSLVLASVVGVAPAQAATDTRAHVPTSSPASQLKYSDQDVVNFFAFGSGPAAATHQDLMANLGITPQAVPAKVLTSLTKALLSVDPNFHQAVTVDVQAGDPYKAESAVKTLVADVRTLQSQVAKAATTDASAASARAAGSGGYQVFAFAYVAVSTVLVVAAGGVVSVIAVFLALYQSQDSSHLTRDNATASLASSF